MNNELIFDPTNLISVIEDSDAVSPSGQYSLVVETYKTGAKTWDYTKGIVSNKKGEIIAEIERNYSVFWHCWLEFGNREYMLCGQHYQGYGAVDLKTGESNFLTDLGPVPSLGTGFCWIECQHYAENEVKVEGCVWGGPMETILYRITHPLVLPYEIIDRYYKYGEGEEE